MRNPDIRVVHTAASYTEAQLLVGLLESEGVAARTGGSELMDEFSVAQRLIGPTEVIVQDGDLELAKDVVAAWRAHKTEQGDGPEDPEEPS